MLDPAALAETLGRIDIYLLDQILRGHVQPGMRVIDVGCGHGRNLVYLMRAGFDVSGLDPDAEAIKAVRSLATALVPGRSALQGPAGERFRQESAESSSFPDGSADLVISNAVLHFSRDHAHFDAQLQGIWRLLAPGGLFFARLGSTIGIDCRVQDLGNGRFLQPDGSQLYLVSLEQLLAATEKLGGRLVDPIKTTNVQNLRCMTTWVMQK